MSKIGFELINELTRNEVPFLCLIDFDQLTPLVYTLESIDPTNLQFDINGSSNTTPTSKLPVLTQWDKLPVDEFSYRKAFDKVQFHLHYGDTFLLNLTFPTKVKTNLNLQELFQISHAKYKVWLKDSFVTFSPESFIKVEAGTIASFPMKGTIRSSEPDAASSILNNSKESEEHLTIVDLIRNDLAMVAEGIKVENFRYLENIKTAQSD
jgi:para-aminobenzoate synthetase component 1